MLISVVGADPPPISHTPHHCLPRPLSPEPALLLLWLLLGFSPPLYSRLLPVVPAWPHALSGGGRGALAPGFQHRESNLTLLAQTGEAEGSHPCPGFALPSASPLRHRLLHLPPTPALPQGPGVRGAPQAPLAEAERPKKHNMSGIRLHQAPDRRPWGPS